MKVRDLIDIEFPYNGNLGVLQQKTFDNAAFCGRLLQSGVISRDEWRETADAIGGYFAGEIKKAVEYMEEHWPISG